MPTSIPVRACPHCHSLFKSPEQEAPHFAQAYRKTGERAVSARCHRCHESFAVAEAKLIGHLPLSALHPRYSVSVTEKNNQVWRVVAEGIGVETADSVAAAHRALGLEAKVERSTEDPRWDEWARAPLITEG